MLHKDAKSHQRRQPPAQSLAITAEVEIPHYERALLDRISDQWTFAVVTTLTDGPQRFNALTRTIAGISPKMLTHTLRVLERDGLLTRTSYADMPPHVEYDLTDLGESLAHLLEELDGWAYSNMRNVTTARGEYDSHPPATRQS